MRFRFLLLLVLSFIVIAFPNLSTIAQATITVTSSADNTTTDGNCTLREAITNANNNAATFADCTAGTGTGTDTIQFNIAGAGPHTINLVTTTLPAITSPVIINGLTQAGADCQTELMIVINGTAVAAGSGITLQAGGNSSTVRGLVINNFASGIGINISSSSNHRIQCNFLGTDSTGTSALGNGNGIFVGVGSVNNIIGTDGDGTDDADEGNLVSGNGNNGISMTGAGTNSNRIAGNRIGTNLAGTADLGNGGSGISITTSASNNIIGTNGDGNGDADEGNLISGNNNNGVLLNNAVVTTRIAGNYIGTDITGTSAIPNSFSGVSLQNSATGNIIGTNGDGTSDVLEGNVISGNSLLGISIISTSSGNVVAGNLIGTDVTGMLDLGNGNEGIIITTSNNRVGTNGDGVSDTLERNIISGNSFEGIDLSGSGVTGNVIAGNYIGTNITGTAGIFNIRGIFLQNGANGNFIGTNSDGNGDANEGNVISGNGQAGITLSGATVTNNRIAGNFIGTDPTGSLDVGNSLQGVSIQNNANNNTIGVFDDGISDALERNIISGNGNPGVLISAPNNRVSGNYIGTNLAGTASIQNLAGGLFLTNSNTLVGTDNDGISDALEGNVISGNDAHGITISGATATDNVISGNIIGLNAAGTASLTNTGSGIVLNSSASNNTIGGNADVQSNIISGNTSRGVFISGADVTNNVINNNYIGTNPSGAVLNNGARGIEIIATGTALTTISNNWIFYHPVTGIILGNAADLGAAGISEQNCLYQNATGVNNLTGTNIFFENNWWGAASGPSGAGTGNGDSVSANVDYQAFLTTAPTGCPGIAGVIINPLALSAAEGGALSYTIVLDSQPAAGEVVTITIAISGSAAGEIASTSPSLSFNFNDINWNTPQQFDITLNDDLITNGNRSYTAAFTHSSDSSDPASGYDAAAALVIDSVDLDVIDDESPNVVINPTAFGLRTGNSNTYDVSLTLEPASDVTITLSQLDANCTISTTTLTFTNSAGASPWNVPQTVTVTGVGAAGSICTIQHTPTGGGYDAVLASDVVVNLRRAGTGTSPSTPVTGGEPAITVFDPAISKLGTLFPGQTGIVGEELEWIVTVSNVGTVAGVNVTVTDTLIAALQVDSVDAPGGTVTINGQTVTVVYPSLAVGQTVQFSIFTTVLSGATVDNTACVNASNQAAPECVSATSGAVSQLPSTGESPLWRFALLVGVALIGLLTFFYLYSKPKTKSP